ncbi:MAG: hypothetical protein ACKODX_15560 [Gemmata sp.]
MIATERPADPRCERGHDPLARDAARLCAELTDGAVRAPAAPDRLGDWFRRAVLGDPAARLERHRRQLASGEQRPIALLRFARFLEGSGLGELATVPWSELARVCPDDPVPAVALARLFLARARRGDRSTAERLRDFDRFFRYARRATVTLPDPGPVPDWVRAAAAEMTLLKGQYEHN